MRARIPRKCDLSPGIVLLGLLFVGACGTVPPDRYGVNRIRFEGVDAMDEGALRDSLATAERRRVFGLFKIGWPLFDRTIFERDLRRVERWYRARGYYGARIQQVSYDPPEAALNDRVDANAECERIGSGEGCAVELEVRLEEGEPVRVRQIELEGVEGLSEGLRASLPESYSLSVGERFDEAFYDQTKVAMVRALQNATYACAEVSGSVEVDSEGLTADVTFAVEPSVPHRIGTVTLTGEEDLRRVTILATADIEEGDDYAPSVLEEARHAVYALGAFSSVDVIGIPRRREGEDGEETCVGVVDVEIRVTPGRLLHYGVGGGIQSGTISADFTDRDVQQWDIHLLGFIEHRNFLGGLRRIRIEDRPKLIFPDTFPSVRRTDTRDDGTVDRVGPRPGNELRIQFRQPAFIEARTTGVITARWDFGLDPNDAFFRHNIDTSIGVRRSFLNGRLNVALGFRYDFFLRTENVDESQAEIFQSDYQVTLFEQRIQIDLRDDTRAPRLGAYFSLDAQEAAFLDWNYVRLVPDVRAYVPLGPFVLAGRFRLGYMRIFSASESLDATSSVLGPQRFRLRLGGANSHRGYTAGFLGDDDVAIDSADPDSQNFRTNSGGLRRWEASLEFRVPFTEDFGAVLFADMGDVNRGANFRFDQLNLALGFGLRYQTLIGPVRFDFGMLVPGAQTTRGCQEVRGSARFGIDGGGTCSNYGLRGAFHLTIGEAF